MGAPPGAAAASELNTSSQGGSILDKRGGVWGVWVPCAQRAQGGGGGIGGDQGLGPP